MSYPASPAPEPHQLSLDLSRIGATQFAAAAQARTLPLDAYTGLLRCLAVMYEALEFAADGPARSVLQPLPDAVGRLHLLQNDLDAIGQRVFAPVAEAELRAVLHAERIRLWSEHNPAALLGVAAVLGGAAVAAAAPPAAIARCFRFKRRQATTFVAHSERAAQADAGMAAGETEPDAAAMAQTSATLLAIVKALHPANPQPLSQLAKVVNPHAGNYLIPDDLGEIRAALRAGARTWDEIPYYGLRFAERGREWTWSDSCWLATLAQLEQKAVDAQVAWVGRLLAARGMPQLLLEQHLYALAEELGTAHPAQRSRYARLSVAAGTLAAQRQAQIGDEHAREIAAAFDALELGGPPDAKFGAVLVAAVADEAAGVPRAVESLTVWAADTQRFPQPWVDAVHATIAAARAAVR